MIRFQRFFLISLIAFFISACSVEVKPLDGTSDNESARDTSTSENSPAQDSADTTSTENPPADEINKEKCASGNLIDDIQCDVDTMEL